MTARKMGDGAAIVLPISEDGRDIARVYRLNEVGAFIWDRLDGTRTVSELASEVCRCFVADPTVVEEHLTTFLAELERIGIVAV